MIENMQNDHHALLFGCIVICCGVASEYWGILTTISQLLNNILMMRNDIQCTEHEIFACGYIMKKKQFKIGAFDIIGVNTT